MAEKRVIDIEIESNLGSLKEQLRSARQNVSELSVEFGRSSKEVADAADQVRSLEKEIKQTNKTLKSISIEGKFNAISGSISGVLNGVQAFQGSLGLIGVESEAVNEALLKVNSAMALTDGVEGIFKANESFKKLKTTLKESAVGQGILTAATTAYTFVTSAATTGLKLFRIALIGTGIGILIVGIGLLIANFDKVTKVFVKFSGYLIKAYDYFDNLGTGIKVLVAIFFPFIGVIYAAIKALEYFNIIDTKNERDMSARHEANMKRIDKELAKREKQKEARKKQYEDEDKALGRQIALLDAQGKSSDALVEKRIKNSIAYQKSLLKELEINERILKATNLSGLNNDLITQTQKAIEDTTNAILDAENQLDINQAEIDKERADKAKEQAKKIADERLQAQQNYNNKLREFQDAIEAERQSKITDAKEKELQDLDNKYEQLYAKADAAGQSDKELIAKQQAEITAINDKYAKIQADALLKAKAEAKKLELQQEQEFQAKIEEIDEANFQAGLQKTMTEEEYQLELVRQKYFTLEELAKGNAEQLAIIEQAKANEIGAINKKHTEEQIALEQSVMSAKLKIAKDTFNLISNITELFGRQNEKNARIAFKIDKAAKISSAIIAGIEGTIEAYKTASKSPITALFPAYPAIQAGLAGAFAATGIAKIASTQFGSGGGGGGGDTPAPTAGFNPSFNVVGNSGINQLAGIQQQPVKAYITTSEVSTALSLERNTLQKTTF